MRVLILSLAIIVADQGSKLLVKGVSIPWLGVHLEGMQYGASRPVLGEFFRLTYIENPGMAFGIDLGGKLFFSIFSVVASLAILFYLYRARSGPLGFRISLAMILGGAVGNLIDRMFYGVIFGDAPLFYGRVVDFFDVDFFNITIGNYHLSRWPVFNIADASVSIGVLLLLIFHRSMVRDEREAMNGWLPLVTGTCLPAASGGNAGEPGLMPHTLEIIVPPGKKKERLDLFLTHHVENATRTKVQRAIRDGLVLLGGKTVRSSYCLTGGEVIQVTLPAPPPQDALPEPIPLDIIHEDDALLVVNKPAGMVTHPAHGNYTGTLVNAVLYHCGGLSALNDPLRPGIVHRLDKDTSGLMVVAKTEHALAALARQFARRTVRREYQAIVWGVFKRPKGLIEADLGRSKQDRKKMAVVKAGKPAATEYELLEQFPYLALIRLKLRTGRTHQIRVHLAHINHPVFGDPTYNGRHLVAGPGTPKQKSEVENLLALIPRQALHARTIGFTHPESRIAMDFDSALPADMETVLQRLRGGGPPA